MENTLIDIEAAWARAQKWYPGLSRATFEDARHYLSTDGAELPEAAWLELERHQLARESERFGWIMAADLMSVYYDQGPAPEA